MTARTRVPRAAWIVALAAGLLGLGAGAGEVHSRVQARGELKVCIWPDYPRISFRDPRTGQLSGLDVDLATALAGDLQVRLQFVESSFVSLVQDLHSDRCDVAMFGIAMLPQRTAQLQFSTPYLHSGIHAVANRASRVVRQWADIDRPGVLVGVQAGTFMEQVMRERLQHASLVSIQPPQTRERELMAGRVDVFMTDYPYGTALVESSHWASLLVPPEPVQVLPYAHASKPGDAAWLATLNAFMARIRKDGRLDAAARRHGLAGIVLHAKNPP